ncbi:hypothetical protein MKX01_021273 [Papaver californicum]|nr:hypothetical protein MKX01_021273 [Papaver californicum]
MEENHTESDQNKNVENHFVNGSDGMGPSLKGMVFDDYKQMFDFYEEYGRKKGFLLQKNVKKDK